MEWLTGKLMVPIQDCITQCLLLQQLPIRSNVIQKQVAVGTFIFCVLAALLKTMRAFDPYQFTLGYLVVQKKQTNEGVVGRNGIT